MVLRDLTISGRLPELNQLTYVTSGIVYPIGGQIHRWLADTYGDWRVALMYKELNRHDTFEAALHAVYGRTMDQLSEEFKLACGGTTTRRWTASRRSPSSAGRSPSSP